MAADRVVAIVQARMGSARLPGKSLAPFAGSTVLQHMVERLRLVSSPLEIVVATSDRDEDDEIVRVCAEAAVQVFRGEADDVLARFVGCVDSLPVRSDMVLRVCADRPLLCPVVIDELVAAYDELGRPDYVSNNRPPSYPDGLDVELVRTQCLEEAHRESNDPYEREHVTPFVYRRPERFSLGGVICPFGNFSHVRLALDTREDLERLRDLHERLPTSYDYRDILTEVELSA
jgi:spore coat polysaccharide biosynthesis protein SpsF